MKDRINPLFKQTIIYSLGSLAVPLMGIFLVPIYTRVFVPSDYGIISLVQVTIAFLGVFLILGTDNATVRYYIDSNDEQDKKRTASTAMLFRVILLAAGSTMFILFSGDISQLIFGTTANRQYLIIAAAALPFLHSSTLCRNMLRFNFRSTSYSILSAAAVVVRVSLIIFFVLSLKWGISGIFAAGLLSSALFLVINFSVARRYFSLTFSTKRLKELLQFGVPLVPYGITVYLIQNSDRYFLSYFSTLEQVGLYSVGLQLAWIIGLSFVGTGLAWGPFVYSTYKEGDIKAVYSRVANYFVSAAFFLVVVLSLFSREIMMLFTTPAYFGAYTVVPILALYLAFYHLGLRMSFGISIAKKTLHFTWISAVTAAVNIGLNFLLVPAYGMMGAAIATLACSIVWFILLVVISQKHYHVEYSVASFLKIIGVTFAIISLSYFLTPHISAQSILIKIGLISVFIFCLFIFKLVSKEDLNYLKQLAYERVFRRFKR